MEKEKEKERENEEKNVKSTMALRHCAKAALILHRLNSTKSENEKMIMKKEIEQLKIQLMKQRYMNKKMKLSSFIEMFLQFLLLLVCTFFFLFLHRSR